MALRGLVLCNGHSTAPATGASAEFSEKLEKVRLDNYEYSYFDRSSLCIARLAE